MLQVGCADAKSMPVSAPGSTFTDGSATRQPLILEGYLPEWNGAIGYFLAKFTVSDDAVAASLSVAAPSYGIPFRDGGCRDVSLACSPGRLGSVSSITCDMMKGEELRTN